MKKNVVVSLLTLALLSTACVVLPVKAVDYSQDKGTLSVSYSVEKEVAPDTVEVSIAIKTSDKKSMQVAVSKNKEISGKVYEFLKSNINTSNGDYVKTANYSAQPVYTWNSGKRDFNRFDVSNNIIVHTKGIEKIGELIDKSLQMGATDVNSLNFFTRNDLSIGDFGYALEKAGVDYFPYIGKELPRSFFAHSDLTTIIIPPPIENSPVLKNSYISSRSSLPVSLA